MQASKTLSSHHFPMATFRIKSTVEKHILTYLTVLEEREIKKNAGF